MNPPELSPAGRVVLSATRSGTMTATEFGDPTQLVPVTAAEDAFVGALLHLDARRARLALEHIEAGDLADPRLSTVLSLVRQLADRDVDPDPAAVVAEAWLFGKISGEHRRARLADTVVRVYLGSTASSAAHYRLAVLGDALARQLVATSQRLGQVAAELPPSQYRRVIDEQTSSFRALWTRWLDAGGDDDVPESA